MNKLQILITILTMLQHVPLGNSEKYFNKNNNPPQAIYVFGDSLVDSGNNNLLPTLAKADYLPYGMNFPNGAATGRFTNGRTVADFIAEFFGLPYSPAYLRSVGELLQAEAGDDHQTTFIKGLNYASGSCGILSDTGREAGKCLSLADQMDLFALTVREKLPKHFNNNPNDLSNYLSRSLFIVAIGSNDYLNNYLNNQHETSKLYTPESFAKLLMDKLLAQFQRLYTLGARRVVMFEMGPIGCLPSVTKQHSNHAGDDGPACVENINQLAVILNQNLISLFHNLNSAWKDSDFVLAQGFNLGYDAVVNPSKYGLKDSSKPCCVTWFVGPKGCIPELGKLACHDPQNYYFWDGYHPTEAVYQNIAFNFLNGSSYA